MTPKARAALERLAAKRGLSVAKVGAGLARAIKDGELQRERREQDERETREAQARTKPYDAITELRQLEADGERLLRESEARHAPQPTIQFAYADGTPCELTYDELAGVQRGLAEDLRAGTLPTAERQRLLGALVDANTLARQHGLPTVPVDASAVVQNPADALRITQATNAWRAAGRPDSGPEYDELSYLTRAL